MLHETMEISLKRAKLEKMIHLANPKKIWGRGFIDAAAVVVVYFLC